MRVEFSASAERQLLEGLRYIADDRPSVALRLFERVEAALDQLSDFPDSGRHLPEFPSSPYREMIVSPFRLIYRRRDEGLVIVAVWHEAQLLRRPEDDSA